MAFVDPASEHNTSATTSKSPDLDDVDPLEFLKSVRELSAQREQEDLERYRKLEEEVARSKHEREGRRRERANSLSHEKPHSSRDLPRLHSRADVMYSTRRSLSPPSSSVAGMEGRAGPPSPTRDIPEFKGFGSARSSVEGQPQHQSASSLARSGTLTWQQRRPQSGGGCRPTFVVGSEADAPKEQTGMFAAALQRRPASRGGSRPTSIVGGDSFVREAAKASKDSTELIGDQIAASSGTNDPSWSRQTANGGVGSAAYRKNQVEGASYTHTLSSNHRRDLPGMSREPSLKPEGGASPAPFGFVKSDTSRPTSIRDSGFARDNSSRITSITGKPDLQSLIAEDQPQREASPMSDGASSVEKADLGRAPPMSSTQSSLAKTTERPGSPTKGMGGFVQSAMMKRSDSVSKRWSAQPGGTLHRGNSVTSLRSGGLQGSHSMPRLEPTSSSRESNHEPSTRPTSSSSNLTELAARADNESFIKPFLPRHHSRSKSVVSTTSASAGGEGAVSIPSSPNKRFSPTKSSWIESALTRPESPKPGAPAATRHNAMPSWMANVAKAKAEKAERAGASPENTSREGASRPASPTKTTPFGQSMLKRSESRDTALSPGALTLGSSAVVQVESADAATRTLSTPVSARLTNTATEPQVSTLDVKPKSEAHSAPEREPNESSLEAENPSHTEVEAAKSPPSLRASQPKPVTERPPRTEVEPAKSPPPRSAPNLKPETPSKVQTDFRGTLRSRPAAGPKQQDQPEFLSKFGALRKTQAQKYVAEDVFGNNIRAGKADLTKTGEPVKTARRDELKESLLAKKEDWKKAKEEGRELPGQIHERKISGNGPAAPAKREALARRELLGRSEGGNGAQQWAREGTTEAVARMRSLEGKPKPGPPTAVAIESSVPDNSQAQGSMAPPSRADTAPSTQDTAQFAQLAKQASAPGAMEHKQPSETSKLAARFNPCLAGLLARGPPPASNGPSRSESPAVPERTGMPIAAEDTPKVGAPLHDMRKDRARAPMKRKGGAASGNVAVDVDTPEVLPPARSEHLVPEPELEKAAEPPTPVPPTKPSAPPGSAASIMTAYLKGQVTTQEASRPPERSFTLTKRAGEGENPAPMSMLMPRAPHGSAALVMTPSPLVSPRSQAEAEKPATPAESTIAAQPSTPAAKVEVPEFGGFRSQKSTPASKAEDYKETADISTPSVRSAASFWTRHSPPKKTEAPPQIQLPSKKDEEAAMRSAELLAASPARSSSSNGLGIEEQKANGSSVAPLSPPVSAGLPPRPAKSSRAVSGQLQEASLNKDALSASPELRTEAGWLLCSAFGSIPQALNDLTIDVRAVLTVSQEGTAAVIKTLRKSIEEVAPGGSARPLPQQEEYTLFSESVYICSHSSTTDNGTKKTQKVFVWSGSQASSSATDAAQILAKRTARETGASGIMTLRQGYETHDFLQALGGILVTRRGPREGAPKQYMLCGRKHLGHICFDEMDFSLQSLCSGFVYLISCPVTLQETKLYLWKGSACSNEELSAARLSAMDISETGEIIEVDDGAEFASFLKVFGRGTTKASVPKPTELWKQKALAPDAFSIKLFRIQQAEQKVGLFTNMFTRRPSWQSPSGSPSRDGPDGKVEAKHISPFMQVDLEAEGIYILDAHLQLYVLLGPLFPSQQASLRDVIFRQALLFACEYAAADGRSGEIRKFVLFGGVPRDVKMLFRHWDESRGLWGTAGLMAGSQAQIGDRAVMLSLDEVMNALSHG